MAAAAESRVEGRGGGFWPSGSGQALEKAQRWSHNRSSQRSRDSISGLHEGEHAPATGRFSSSNTHELPATPTSCPRAARPPRQLSMHGGAHGHSRAPPVGLFHSLGAGHSQRDAASCSPTLSELHIRPCKRCRNGEHLVVYSRHPGLCCCDLSLGSAFG